MGGCVADVDTATGGPAHDIRRPAVLQRWRRTLRSGEVDVIWGGGPCATFSPRHVPQLRSISEPEGITPLPAEWRAHILSANAVWDNLALLAREQYAAGGEFVLEYPQRRYIEGRRAFWRKMARRGICTPGDLPSMLALERDTGAVRIDIAQCALGGRFQKFTTLLCSPRIAQELSHLADLRCELCDCYVVHEERATGVFADGSSRAAAAAAYPSELNHSLAAAGAACRRGPRRSPPPADSPSEAPAPPPDISLDGAEEDDDGLSDALSQASTAREPPWDAPRREVWEPKGATADGGDPAAAEHQMRDSGVAALEGDSPSGIAAGPALPTAVRARLEAARVAPPRFASLRNLADATAGELRRATIPHLAATRRSERPPPEAAAWGADRVGPQSGRPVGPIRIEDLFLDGVFQQIEEWRGRAELALRDIAAGRPARPLATLTIPQHDLQPWARGVVWDTRDPRDCRPVEPSTAATPDVCSRTLDRPQLRAAADSLNWPDRDLLRQCGHGGVESRSSCSADTVLAFHHAGIVDHFAAADKAVRDDVAAGSVLGGFFTLPFVPCRSLPRNVILQPRSRVTSEGEVEDYDKPRVTTDLSDGVRAWSAATASRPWG